MKKRVMVTGASGFVGSSLLTQLRASGFQPIAALRRSADRPLPAVPSIQVGDLHADTDWFQALRGVESVVHTAARVHVMNEQAADPLGAFRRVNVDGTVRLARQAAEAGVKRFVFISSIKVNGESTVPGRPFTAQQAPAPIDAYGVSKWEAELQLHALAVETGMEVVVIRPVLVYGPGVKANFLSMMKWLYKGAPLPFGAIHNKRSLVALDNLVDLIVTCIDHPGAANQTFLVSDGEDLSTTELLQRMSQALGKQARLLPVPAWMLESAAKVVGKQSIAQRLCGSLQVDIAHTHKRLGWTPPVDVETALQRTAQHFVEQQKQ